MLNRHVITNIKYVLLFCSLLTTPLLAQTRHGGHSGQGGGEMATYIGWYAGNKNLNYATVYNTFIGGFSGKENTSGQYNTFLGIYSGYKNTTANHNTFIGAYSGFNNTLGFENTFIGSGSGKYNTLGGSNTFVGTNVGFSNTTGAGNTFLGLGAGQRNTTGSSNVFLGRIAGASHTNSRYNVFIGDAAGSGRNANGALAEYNVFIGMNSGSEIYSGKHNIFLGNEAGYKMASGSNNLMLGNHAGFKNIVGNGNVFLGSRAGYNEIGSNKLYIDNSSTTAPLIKGDFSTNQLGINTGTFQSGYALTVGGAIRSTGSLSLGGAAYIDDDVSPGGNSDDWMRLNGYIELKSNTDHYGIVLRDKDNGEFFGITQKNGWSYLADSQGSGGYFLRGNGANVEVRGTIKAANLAINNWNTAFAQRGSAIAGAGLSWTGGKLVVASSTISGAVNYLKKTGTNLSYTTGNLGIGTSSPKAALHITSMVAENTPTIEGTQISRGRIELTRAASTPWIDFQNDIAGGTTTYDARLELVSDNDLALKGANLRMEDRDLLDVRSLQLKDWDDNTGGRDNKYRLIARDGAMMFHDGGVVVGSYGNGNWTDLPTGRLIVKEKLGIGKTVPVYPLDVLGTIRTSGALRIVNDNGLLNETDGTSFYSDDANYWRSRSDRGITIANKANVRKGVIYHDNANGFGLLDADHHWSIKMQKDSYTSFAINNSEKMRILSNGKVGIGTATPASKLDVAGVITATGGNSGQWNAAYAERGSQIAGTGLSWADGKLNLSLGIKDWSFNNKNLRNINNIQIGDPGTNEGISWGGTAAKIFVSELGGSQKDGYLRLVNDGGISFEAGEQNVESMVITADGKVGIGTTTPAEMLHIKGAIRGHLQQGALRIQSATGYVDVGSQNDAWAHFQTDRPSFYFNKGIAVDQGLIGSYNENLQLRAAGVTGLTIAKTNQKVTIHKDLQVDGMLKLATSKITEDNTPDGLLVMKPDGTLATRSVRSIESPWLLDLVGKDKLSLTCDQNVLGHVIIDVFDLNGNLRIGDNSYIDDDLEYGDNGALKDQPDDWMRFGGKIEFKSSADKFGIVLYDKISYLNYLNLYQDGGTSYISNSSSSDDYFLKSTGRDVVFGGKVTVPSLETAGYSSNESLHITIDANNDKAASATKKDAFVIASNANPGQPDYNELLRIEENGALYLSKLAKNVTNNVDEVLVREATTGEILSRDATKMGPWTLASTDDLTYDKGSIGLGIAGAPTTTLDIGKGSLRIRSLATLASATNMVMTDDNGKFYKRDLSTLNLSPWMITADHLRYGGQVKIGSDEAPKAALDVTGGVMTDELTLSGISENSSFDDIVVSDAFGKLHTRKISTLVGIENNALNTFIVTDASGNLFKKNLTASTLLKGADNSLNTFVVADSKGDFHTRSLGSIVGDASSTTTEMVVKTADGSLHTRSVNTLVGNDDASIESFVVKAADGSLHTRGYNSLIGGADNSSSKIVMLDANNKMAYRELSSFKFSPWRQSLKPDDATEESYHIDSRVGIGAENLSDNIATLVTTNKQMGLVVNSSFKTKGGYGIRSEVANDKIKAFAVINTTTGADVYRVYGDGIVEAKEVIVSQEIWHDAVFKQGYELMPIEQVEAYVNEHNHLPEVPSESEVLENGVNIGDMEAILLKKVEELTLYVIEQSKQLKAQAERIQELESNTK